LNKNDLRIGDLTPDDYDSKKPGLEEIKAELGSLPIAPDRVLKRADVSVAVIAELKRLRNELLAGISREPRYPLPSKRGFTAASLLPDIECKDHQTSQMVKIVEQETERLQRIVTELADVSYLNRRPLKLQKNM
jgi:two-component system sensor histidine kinase ResE